MFSQKGKYFSKFFFTIFISLQIIIWIGVSVGGIFSMIAFQIMFVPLLPFVLTGWRIFNPDAYPTFFGWILLIILHLIFSYYVASIASPLMEGFLRKKKNGSK